MTIQSRVSTSFDLKRISLNVSANLNQLINVNNLLINISEKSYEKVRSKNGGKVFNFSYMKFMGRDLIYYMGNDN